MVTKAAKQAYFVIREKIRLNPVMARTIYLVQSLLRSNTGEFRNRVLLAKQARKIGKGIALCCRIRDEAPYLAEFIEYYRAAGVEHFFIYESGSTDSYKEVLRPFIDSGIVSLYDRWPHVPVSPAAEQDCVLRGMGRFEWIGFIDVDEFVVIRDGSSIGEFLARFNDKPAVALHWYIFGSNGHKTRPSGPVIEEYSKRSGPLTCTLSASRGRNWWRTFGTPTLGISRK